MRRAEPDHVLALAELAEGELFAGDAEALEAFFYEVLAVVREQVVVEAARDVTADLVDLDRGGGRHGDEEGGGELACSQRAAGQVSVAYQGVEPPLAAR